MITCNAPDRSPFFSFPFPLLEEGPVRTLLAIFLVLWLLVGSCQWEAPTRELESGRRFLQLLCGDSVPSTVPRRWPSPESTPSDFCRYSCPVSFSVTLGPCIIASPSFPCLLPPLATPPNLVCVFKSGILLNSPHLV